MNDSQKRRAFKRYKYRVPVKVYADGYNGYQAKNEANHSIALMKNYSRGGVYFETDTFIPPGTLVTVSFSNEPDILTSQTGKNSKAKVVWCKKLTKPGSKSFGVGLKYDTFSNCFFFGF